MLNNQTKNTLLTFANSLWNHKEIILFLGLFAYRLHKVHKRNKKWDDFMTARFSEENLELQIQSCLEFGMEYFQGGDDVSYNEEDMKILASLIIKNPEFHKIHSILMAETHLSNQGVAYLAEIPHLKCLKIGYNDITDEGLEIIGKKCVNLVDLDISGNPITKLDPLYNLKKLEVLIADQTDIKDCDDLWLESSEITTVSFSMTAIGAERREIIEKKFKIKRQKRLASGDDSREK